MHQVCVCTALRLRLSSVSVVRHRHRVVAGRFAFDRDLEVDRVVHRVVDATGAPFATPQPTVRPAAG